LLTFRNQNLLSTSVLTIRATCCPLPAPSHPLSREAYFLKITVREVRNFGVSQRDLKETKARLLLPHSHTKCKSHVIHEFGRKPG
jgi:hypothetical protein